MIMLEHTRPDKAEINVYELSSIEKKIQYMTKSNLLRTLCHLSTDQPECEQIISRIWQNTKGTHKASKKEGRSAKQTNRQEKLQKEEINSLIIPGKKEHDVYIKVYETK